MSQPNAPYDVAFTWLLLADVHGAPRRSDGPVDDTALLGALYSDVHALATVAGPPTALFVAGDVVHAPTPEGYERAATILSQIGEAAGATNPQVFVVPGNHDVDRDRCEDELDAAGLRAALREQPARVDRALAHYGELLLRPMEAFSAFAAGLTKPNGGTSWPAAPAPWWVHRTRVAGHSLRIVGWNSALTSDGTDAPGALVTSPEMARAALATTDDELVLVLGHHPLEWLREGAALGEALDLGAQVYMHAHAHDGAALGPAQSPNGMLSLRVGGYDDPAQGEEHARFRYALCRLEVTAEGPRLRVWARVTSLGEPSFGPEEDVYGATSEPDESWVLPLRAPAAGWRKGSRARSVTGEGFVPPSSMARRVGNAGESTPAPGSSVARRLAAQGLATPVRAAAGAPVSPASAPSSSPSRANLPAVQGGLPAASALLARGTPSTSAMPAVTPRGAGSTAPSGTAGGGAARATPGARAVEAKPKAAAPAEEPWTEPPTDAASEARRVARQVDAEGSDPSAWDEPTNAGSATGMVEPMPEAVSPGAGDDLDALAAPSDGGALPGLDDLLPPPDEGPAVVYTAPGPRAKGLLGRGEALLALEAYAPPYRSLRSVAVVGAPGEGTTSLALDFAARAYHQGQFPGGVLWFDAGGPEPLDASVRATVAALGGAGGLEALGPALKQRCESSGALLIILDGCATPSVAPALHGALSMSSVTGLLLVTTADETTAARAAAAGQGSVVRLAALNVEDAVAVLTQNTPLRDTQQLARLAKAVGRNAFAVNVLAAALSAGGANAWNVGEEVLKRAAANASLATGAAFATLEALWARLHEPTRAAWLCGAMAAADGALPLPWVEAAAQDASGDAVTALVNAGIAMVQGEGALGTFRLHRLAHAFAKLQLANLDPMALKLANEGFLRGALAVLTAPTEGGDELPLGAEFAVPQLDALLAMHANAPNGAGRTRAAAVAVLAGGLAGDVKHLGKIRPLLEEAMQPAGLGNAERRRLAVTVLRRVVEHDRVRSINDDLAQITVPAALAGQLRHVGSPEELLEAKGLLESVLNYEKKRRPDDPKLMGRRLELAAVLQRIGSVEALKAGLALAREVDMAAEWEGSVGDRYAEPARKLVSELNATLKALTAGR